MEYSAGQENSQGNVPQRLRDLQGGDFMAWSCVWHLREAWYRGKWHHQRKKHKERGIGMAFKEAAEVFDSANSTLEESRISRALFLNISA